MAYSTKIGDSQPTAVRANVTALPMPVITQVEISAATSAINNTLVSGKKLGACCLMTETVGGMPVMVVAMGTATTSNWIRQDTKVAIVPA